MYALPACLPACVPACLQAKLYDNLISDYKWSLDGDTHSSAANKVVCRFTLQLNQLEILNQNFELGISIAHSSSRVMW